MFNISTLLQGFKRRFDTEQGRSEEIAKIMSVISGLSISKDNITIRKGVVIVTVPPTAKMAILINKEAILRTCKEKGIAVGAIA